MISLREANNDDIAFWLAIRNHPDVYPGFYQQRKTGVIKWEDHCVWWYSRPSTWKKFIVQLDGQDCGIVSFGQLDHWSPEIGYSIHPAVQGEGHGTEAVKMALEKLKEWGYGYCHTTVLKDNERSLKLLKRLGFDILGDAREGELWLSKRLD